MEKGKQLLDVVLKVVLKKDILCIHESSMWDVLSMDKDQINICLLPKHTHNPFYMYMFTIVQL